MSGDHDLWTLVEADTKAPAMVGLDCFLLGHWSGRRGSLLRRRPPTNRGDPLGLGDACCGVWGVAAHVPMPADITSHSFVSFVSRARETGSERFQSVRDSASSRRKEKRHVRYDRRRRGQYGPRALPTSV